MYIVYIFFKKMKKLPLSLLLDPGAIQGWCLSSCSSSSPRFFLTPFSLSVSLYTRVELVQRLIKTGGGGGGVFVPRGWFI